MVNLSSKTGNSPNNIETISFTYNESNELDVAIINKMVELLDLQPRCLNCTSFYKEGALGGYTTWCCKRFGCLEYLGNPHFDMDGSKCEFYERKEKDKCQT